MWRREYHLHISTAVNITEATVDRIDINDYTDVISLASPGTLTSFSVLPSRRLNAKVTLRVPSTLSEYDAIDLILKTKHDLHEQYPRTAIAKASDVPQSNSGATCEPSAGVTSGDDEDFLLLPENTNRPDDAQLDPLTYGRGPWEGLEDDHYRPSVTPCACPVTDRVHPRALTTLARSPRRVEGGGLRKNISGYAPSIPGECVCLLQYCGRVQHDGASVHMDPSSL